MTLKALVAKLIELEDENGDLPVVFEDTAGEVHPLADVGAYRDRVVIEGGD